MAAELWAVGVVIFSGIIGSFGSIFLKLGSANLNKNITTQFKNYRLILGMLVYIISAAMFIPALKGGDLSLLYPLASLSYVWVSILSILVLKEKMNSTKWFGILLILVGVSLIGLGS